MPPLPFVSGHAPGDLREALEEAVYARDDVALWKLTGKLWNCSDVMPSVLCDQARMPQGSTYAQFGRQFRLWRQEQHAAL